MSTTKKLSTWQEKLVEVRKMQGQSGLKAFERARLLNEIFEDQAWRDRATLADDDKAMKLLDPEVEDLCLSFAELRSMLNFYPNREVWGSGKLWTLFKEMRQAQEDAGKKNAEEKPARKGPVARVEYEKLEQEKKEVEYKVKQLNDAVAQERDEISQLRRENADLREQLAEARGRIKQLERQLSREMAAA